MGKYLYKAIALPKVIGEQLEAKRAAVSATLGFELSLADTIAYLLKRDSLTERRDSSIIDS